tara:strand:+ start:103 stop:630 length:528 start_codon:yes stop_codon:yes gene_type:complete
MTILTIEFELDFISKKIKYDFIFHTNLYGEEYNLRQYLERNADEIITFNIKGKDQNQVKIIKNIIIEYLGEQKKNHILQELAKERVEDNPELELEGVIDLLCSFDQFDIERTADICMLSTGKLKNIIKDYMVINGLAWEPTQEDREAEYLGAYNSFNGYAKQNGFIYKGKQYLYN